MTGPPVEPPDDGAADRSNGSETDSVPSLVAILATALGTLRERPRLAGPFLLTAVVGAASTVARLETPYAVSVAPFPREGVVRVPLALVPALEPAIELGPATLLGLKPAYLAVLVGWQAALAVVVATAFAAVVWQSAPETAGRLPPGTRVARLAGYVLAVQLAFAAAAYAIAATPAGALGLAIPAVLVAVPIAVGLFLTPAWIVLAGKRPVAAARESVAEARSRPVSVAALLVAVGYLGYAATGVAHLVPASDPAVPVAVGTIASVAVAGTVHAAVVAAAYRRRPVGHGDDGGARASD